MHTKEVYFDKWCSKCKHSEESEFDVNSTCFDCMYDGSNEDSHKPVNWEKKDEDRT